MDRVIIVCHKQKNDKDAKTRLEHFYGTEKHMLDQQLHSLSSIVITGLMFVHWELGDKSSR